VKFKEKETEAARPAIPERDFLAQRRAFWIFLAIFSVTIFAASAQLASGFWRYCETARRGSQPSGFSASSSRLAAAPVTDDMERRNQR
jgi:hypothetical protein